MKCRHCGHETTHKVLDLGTAPPSNNYVSHEDLRSGETWYPLRIFFCDQCWLVQADGYSGDGPLFNSEYAYFSSYSQGWLDHAKAFVKEVQDNFGLDCESFVVEVASNDGYLLQHVKTARIPCLGVEPTASTAQAARAKGIEVVETFFGEETARKLLDQKGAADLLVANNVLAHVPDIVDFAKGFTTLLAAHGVASFEFPHVVELVQQGQFDTVYHEHFSYLSLAAVEKVFQVAGLQVFDVQRLGTHGGSLRVLAQRSDVGRRSETPTVQEIRDQEASLGVKTPEFYRDLQSRALATKTSLLGFLLQAKKDYQRVVAYGAAAKGNTLFNFAGVRSDLVEYVVDANPNKQGKFLPGSRIPIVAEERIRRDRPDHVLILPWNLQDELADHLAYVHEWDGRLWTAVPHIVEV